MGLCSSSGVQTTPGEKKTSKEVERGLKTDRDREQRIIKLLLLGTGESGKSTIFKQMQIIYEKGFDELQKNTFRHVMRRNVVEAAQTLIEGLEKFNLTPLSASAEYIDYLTDVDPLLPDFWNSKIVDAVHHLWTKDPAIADCYSQRSNLQLLDSTEYLFTESNLKRIGEQGYVPSVSDILRARLRTSGIVEKTITVDGTDMKFLDVGGQRNERRKWIHCFEEVTAVIFVAAINEYDKALYEDEKQNRLMESIGVFDNICNNKYFKQVDIILFLNKFDLFEENIKKKNLNVCFPDYEGKLGDLESARNHVQGKFTEVNKHVEKLIFAHFTTATNTENIEHVFSACRTIILKDSLNALGLS